MNRKQIPYYYTTGGERMETRERMRQASQPVISIKEELKHCGAPMSIGLNSNEYFTTKDELHTFVVGETGSGKTRRVIMPMIQLMAKTGESMIISDPKGELYRTTAANLKLHGYHVVVVNLRDPQRSSCWNPLGEIDRMYRSEDPDDRDRALNELKSVSEELEAGITNGRDQFWLTIFRQMFLSYAEMVLTWGERGSLTFANIEKCATDINKMLQGGGMKRRRFRYWLDHLPESSGIRSNLEAFLTANTSQQNTHMNTFYGAIARFTSQTSLKELFSGSDFSIEDIGKHSTAMFIIVPDESEVMYYICTLLVKQIYGQLVKAADAQKNGSLPVHTNFILDEFANFSVLKSMSSMLTASRSRGIRFTLVCQSMEQLYEKYGTAGAETLMANCRVWIYMNCRNLGFLERLSALAGSYYNPETGTNWPLLTVPQLTHLNPGEVIVFNDRCRPFRGFLPDYSEYDFGKRKDLKPASLTTRRRRRIKEFNIEKVIEKNSSQYSGPDESDFEDVDELPF